MSQIETAFNKLPLSQKIKDWIEVSEGTFRAIEIDRDLNLKSDVDKLNRRVILHRLAEAKVIERVRNVNGVFRKINRTLQEMNLMETEVSQHWIKLPFGLDEMAKIMPGNVITVAGEVNSGKTAFLLNTILLNMKESRRRGQWVHYHNSEMGAGELKLRCEKYMPIEKWDFKAYEHSSNFHDKITPGEINIIDYLVIFDKHWIMGQYIEDIANKIEDGVVIIAMQKHPGRDHGPGGEVTIERARLALAMSNSAVGGNKITITKAKNFFQEGPYGNPYYYSRRYTLAQGIKFKALTDWTPP